MKEKYKFWKSNDPVSILICYIAGLAIVVAAHHLDPTDLGGPGLDIPAFGLYFILNLLLLGKTLSQIFIKNIDKKISPINIVLSLLINYSGIGSIIFLLSIPANSW